MKIIKWKQWYQVQYMGHTIEQFLSQSEAEAYCKIAQHPSYAMPNVSHTERVVRSINVYPNW